MQNQENQQRIGALFQMLFEMAMGNLSVRLEARGADGPLDRLAVKLNGLAGELQDLMADPAITADLEPNLAQYALVLDEAFRIEGFSTGLAELLHFEKEGLLHLDFSEMLAPESALAWEEAKKQLLSDGAYRHAGRLVFFTAQQKLLPLLCSISRLLYSEKVLVSAAAHALRDTDARARPPEQGRTPEAARTLHDYILEHLDEPLPTLKQLAALLGTNDFKLKRDFRKHYHSSIYTFYQEKRLKRAQRMILQTRLPLKEIAYANGFNTYLNFYKAFKKYFKYNPTDLDRGV